VQAPVNTDQQLLAALAAGERRVTNQVYQQHYPVITGWLIKNGAPATDAADLFQEAIVVLFGKAQDKDFRLTSSIGTYLMAVSKHLWYKKLQKNSRDPVFLKEDMGTEEDETGRLADDDIKVHEEREMHFELLNAALDQVGEPCSSLLKAFYHNDKSMQEITLAFGYTNPDNAKNQKYKCLARLRKLFYGMAGTP
jgi:RNA polymerase sigma factor (sigma-70 family)